MAADMGATTLRVRASTRDRINRLAREENLAAGDFVDYLVEKEEHERLLKAMNEDFASLRRDTEAWAAFKAETAAWDTTSSDTAATDVAT
jgi:predicted translin family RNA/ssDNA-binding protein